MNPRRMAESERAWLFRWASETGAQGMPFPEEVEWLGYQRVGQDPRFPTSWLYRRAVSA